VQRIIFLKIGWMDYYDGRAGDQITGNHEYIKKNKTGHEDRNFLAIDKKYIGYAPHNTGGGSAKINFQPYFGLKKTDTEADDVTVVWIATAPEGGVYVVGWYKHAHLFAERKRARGGRNFYAIGRAADARLIPTAERTYRIVKPPHQGAVWYGRDDVIKDVLALIGSGPKAAPKARPKRSVIETALRLEIEKAGMTATQQHLEAQGYTVSYVHKENLGWDLEATSAGVKLLVEVKATQATDPVVELTPNEFAKRVHRDFRIAIVTNALKKPKTMVFRQALTAKEEWRDESGTKRLKFKVIEAARLTVE
jgi:hypothetical protein